MNLSCRAIWAQWLKLSSCRQKNRCATAIGSLKKASTVTGVKVIASGEKIREVQRLIESFPLPNDKLTEAKDWLKCRGTAVITNGTETFVNCEIHWYQCANIGKVDFKVKVWGDKVEG